MITTYVLKELIYVVTELADLMRLMHILIEKI